MPKKTNALDKNKLVKRLRGMRTHYLMWQKKSGGGLSAIPFMASVATFDLTPPKKASRR